MFKREIPYEAKWLKNEMQRFSFKRMIAMYNKLRLQEGKNRLSLSSMKLLVSVYRPDSNSEEKTIRRLHSMLKLTEVKQYADSMLDKAMEANGIDKKWLIEQRKKVVKEAFSTGKLETVNNTLDVLEGYAGMKHTIESQSKIDIPVDYSKLDKEIEATQVLPEHQEATLIPEKLPEKEKVEVLKTNVV